MIAKRSRGHPRTVSTDLVEEIRTRWAREGAPAWGFQKTIAYDLGVSPSYVNQIIRGHRRRIS